MSPFSCTFQVLDCVRKKSSLTTKPVTVRFIRLGCPAVTRGCRTRKMMCQFSIKVRVRLTYECNHELLKYCYSRFFSNFRNKTIIKICQHPTGTADISSLYQKVRIFRDCITGSSWVYDGPYDRAMLGQPKKVGKTEERLNVQEDEQQKQQPQQE